MRRFRFFLLVVAACSTLVVFGSFPLRTYAATTYYVSSSGGTPYQTIAQVNALSLVAGDQVLFKCGDTWQGEQLNITKSGTGTSDTQRITFGSYPAGCTNKPILSGAQPINGWSLAPGPGNTHIYVADLSPTGPNAGKFPLGINQLFRGEERLLLGRWPNITEPDGGYSTIDVHADNQITDTALPPPIDWRTGAATTWVGATTHLRSYRFQLENRAVINHSGQTLTLQTYNYGTTCQGGCTGWGYFLNNHISTLDQDGEWYYDDVAKKVYLYSSSGTSNIEGSVIMTNLNTSGTATPMDHGGIMIGAPVEYVTIKDLALERWFNHGIGANIYMSGEYHHLTINNLTITDVEASGIQFFTSHSGTIGGGHDLTITNNTISGANHFGISLYSSSSTVQSNKVSNIGLIQNFGKNGIGCGISDFGCGDNGDGIRACMILPGTSSSNIIGNNTVTRTGYAGIQTFGSNHWIANNVVKECLYTKSDGACIHVTSVDVTPPASPHTSNVTVKNNIMIDSIGNAEGVNPTLEGVTPTIKDLYGGGILVDGYASGIWVFDNTIKNTSFIGMFYVNSTAYNYGNTCYNTVTGTMYGGAIQTYGTTNLLSSHDNIMYSLNTPEAWTLYVQSISNLAGSSHNYFFHPYKDLNIGVGTDPERNLTQWQNDSGMDADSTANWFTNSDPSVLFYNDTTVAKTFNLGTTLYRDLDNNPVSCSLTLQPFTSKVLLNFGETTSCSYLLWTK